MPTARESSAKSFVLRMNSFTETACAVVILLAVAALVGWAFDNVTLRSLARGFASMKPNEAIAFLLLGTALWILRREDVDDSRRRLAHGAVSLAFAIGAFTLVEHATGWDPGFDQLVFRESEGSSWTSVPGRMAPSAAINFVLLGLALLRLDASPHFRTVQLLALTAILVSLIAHLAYVYALELLHGTGFYTHLSVQSTIAFCLLSGGVLFSRPERGIMAIVSSETAGGRVARALLPPAIIVPALLAWIPVLGAQGKLYGATFGVTLLTVTTVIALSVLVLSSARSLHRADLEQSRAHAAIRKSEEQLREANAELRVRERALQQAFSQLQQAHEELQETQLRLIQSAKLESIGRLAAGVAHEVKNPLAIVQSGADYLLRRPGREAVERDVVEEVIAAARRADAIVRDLLDFSAPRPLELERGDLNATVEQALRLVKHDLERRRVRIERELAPGLPEVTIDPAKIEQVFVNLLLNAAESIDGDGIVTVRTRAAPSRTPDDRPGIVAEIDDTGPGIPEAQLTRIFDPFFTTRAKGTGLGLSVSKTIIGLHGGTIELVNRPQGGVSARVTLYGERSDADEHPETPATRGRRGRIHEAPEAEPRGDGSLRGPDRERREPSPGSGAGIPARSGHSRHHHARGGRR